MTNTVRRIQIPINHVKPLKDNEVMATVEGQVLPTMIDSGAEVTVVPEECVGEQQLTGETVTLDAYNMSQSVGRKYNIQIAVGDRVFSRAAVAQPGEDISWMTLLSFDPYDREETMYLFGQIQLKKDLAEENVHYMPPRMEDGCFHQAVVVSQGTVIEAEEVEPQVVTSGPEPHSEEVKDDVDHADVGSESGEAVREMSLEPEQTTSSVEVEAEGAHEGGIADSGLTRN